jgi:hypothetical protein
MAAVAELVLGGATQVYIRAAQAGWRILREEEKRKIPRTLLSKMVRMKMNNEGVNLKDCPMKTVRIDEDSDCLPLSLIELSHRYSLSLSTHQREVETVVEECWRETWMKKSTIWTQNWLQDDSHKIAQDLYLSRLSTFLPSNQVKLSKCQINLMYFFSAFHSPPNYHSVKQQQATEKHPLN